MYILGISAFYHDSAACLLKDSEIIAAAQEERFTRKKHDAGFPYHAIHYCLKQAGISANLINNVVFYEKPFVKFERLLETYLAFAPKGLPALQKRYQSGLKTNSFKNLFSSKNSNQRLMKMLTGKIGYCFLSTTYLMQPVHITHRLLKVQLF